MNNARLKALGIKFAIPESDLDFVNEAFDLSTFKDPCRVASAASIANLSSVTVADFDGTAQGITLVEGNRVLVKNTSSPDGVIAVHAKYEGIYVVGEVVTGSAALTRAEDANTSVEMKSGTTAKITEGTYAGAYYALTTADPITLGTTSQTWAASTPGALSDVNPQAVGTVNPGVSATISRSDHVHAHGNQSSGDSLHILATAALNGFMSAAEYTKLLQSQLGASVRCARGVVWNNQSDLAAFVVASDDGITYVQGDRVLLVGQTTAAQCGLYVVGAVSGTAPLTRVVDMPAGAAYVNGQCVEISEGTYMGGTTWKARCTGAKVIGTHDPLFYPKEQKFKITLASDTYTLGFGSTATPDEPLFLFSTDSVIEAHRLTQGGTTTNVIMYVAPAANRTNGKAGTAVAIIRSAIAAGTIGVGGDSSIIEVTVRN